MAPVIMRKMIPPYDIYYRYWAERDMILSRIFAGLVHPGEHPGFICVVGEKIVVPSRPAKYYTLAEYEDHDLGNLLRKMVELQDDFKVQETYAPTADQSLMGFLSHFNEKRISKNLEPIELYTPYQFDDGKLYFHLNLLRENLRINSKILNLLDASKIKSSLQQTASNMSNETYQSHPAIAAIGWPFASLVSQAYVPEDGTPAKAITEYDLWK
jgi:hypothetical protein